MPYVTQSGLNFLFVLFWGIRFMFLLVSFKSSHMLIRKRTSLGAVINKEYNL